MALAIPWMCISIGNKNLLILPLLSLRLQVVIVRSIIFMFVVSVAQRLRRQVVALEIEGSNPSTHPCAYSSADKSTGLRSRGSWVRIPLGALC